MTPIVEPGLLAIASVRVWSDDNFSYQSESGLIIKPPSFADFCICWVIERTAG